MKFLRSEKSKVIVCCIAVLVMFFGIRYIRKTNLWGIMINQKVALPAFSYSYFQVDSKGEWVQDSHGDYIVHPGYVRENTYIDPSTTAVIIMDAWARTSCAKVDAATAKNIGLQVLPLLERFLEMKVHTVYVFTNSPSYVPSKIDERVMPYVDGRTVKIRFHQDYPSTKHFVDELKQNGIKSVLYLGYATNMCVLYRDVGIVPVHFVDRELNLYLVPEASLSFVNEDDHDNQMTQDAMEIMLAQNHIARLIHASDILNCRFQ